MKIRYKQYFTALMCTALLASSTCTYASDYQINGLSIKSIRAVGQYNQPEFRDTVELWFTVPLTFPPGYGCIATSRVYIDAKHYHLFAAATLAFAKGRKVNISVDDALPIRATACEVSFLDVLPE